MNFNLYVFGHNKTYSQYPVDSSAEQFKKICNNQKDGIQFTAFRNDKLMHYCYTRKTDSNNGFESFGVAIVFNGVYCKDLKTLTEIFESLFSEIFLRGVFISVNLDGSLSLSKSPFSSNLEEIQNIEKFLRKNFETILKNDFASLNSAFKSNTGFALLSSASSNNDMLNVFSAHEGFTISDFDQSDSEINRVHQELRNLFDEKQKINLQYKKLLGQKKQYKLVGLLAIGVFGAIIALLIFKSDIQRANNKISNLETSLESKEKSIADQKDKINKQQNEISEYALEVGDLERLNRLLNSKIDSKSDSLKILQNKYNQLASDYSTAEYNANYYKRQYNSQASTIAELRQYKPVTYRTRYTKTYLYILNCSDKFQRMDCYYTNANTRVTVYSTKNGYALTSSGYLRLSDIIRD